MIRWIVKTLEYNQDHEVLQRVIVHAPGEKKEDIKREYKHHTRDLLVFDDK